MRKLLYANFYRLFRINNLCFWICFVFIFLYSVFLLFLKQINGGLQTMYENDIVEFNFSLGIQALMMFFSVVYLGSEYSEGAIRNKIISGSGRKDIYLSNLMTVFSVGFIMMIIWFSCAVSGLPALRTWETVWYLAVAAMFLLAVSSIFTLMGMSVLENPMFSCMCICILYFVMMFAATFIYNILMESEFLTDMVFIDGELVTEPEKNPYYIGGTMRNIYQYILDFLPTGQGIQMFSFDTGDYVHIVRMLLSSAFITVSSTITGILLFKRKNIK